jgi:hypothetical protein
MNDPTNERDPEMDMADKITGVNWRGKTLPLKLFVILVSANKLKVLIRKNYEGCPHCHYLYKVSRVMENKFGSILAALKYPTAILTPNRPIDHKRTHIRS